AATTASLDAQQDSSNIAKTQSKATPNELNRQGEGSGSGPGCQETMGGTMAQIRSEGALIQFRDLRLSTGGHTLGSDKGSMTLKELTDLYTTLSHKVLDLEKDKIAQAKEIASLKKRVTKLEQRQKTISTARPDISAARPEVSTAEPKNPPTTITLFDDEYVTIADTLVKMKN
nr:hypothetical protein [Tanacetum cinerariifolium]